ncbi:polyprenyl synthetase family protein [Nocardia arthritidis]|uniref:Polyprenyl synthetase family protein n=1 Tax=Nocardia arthritidis TaxID=228602 RepID=A0A6G9YFS9_9NOCA|nr:polyprenyl synthetase family protein [Nocardia arthritidis]QIS12145.1 polyprenyl synthetase family protein [Nocardia arthritidis]
MTSGQITPPAVDTVATLLRELVAAWPAGRGRLSDMARYAVLPAGKLLRPILVLESARAVGADPVALAPVAVALEFLHVATLVHDDIIDGDQLRRGRPTVHARYGKGEAIVAGDALLLGTFLAIAEGAESFPPAAVLKAVRIVAAAGLRLCDGQVTEAELTGDLDCGITRYRAMAAAKTGALFEAACGAGAILGGGSEAQQAALRAYAAHLGCAFQMRDDLLPYLADDARVGKSRMSDIANRRPTFPVLVAVELADTEQRARLELILSGRLSPDIAHMLLGEVFTETGALTVAAERVAAEAAAARDCLHGFGARGDRLAALADDTIERTW